MSNESPMPVPSAAEPVPAEFDLLCEGCGYSLVGLVGSNRCPECGLDFDPHQLPLARVPWLYRKRLGWWTAYWQTVWLILNDPRTFAQDMCRPVRICAEDAGRFRSVTGSIAAGSSFGLACLGGLVLMIQGSRDAPITIPMAVGLLAGIRVFVHFATDMPTFIWAGPNARDPHQLSPLQHYASAPASLVGVAVAFVGLAGIFDQILPGLPGVVPVIVAGVGVAIALIILVMFVMISVNFMRVASNGSPARAAVLAIYLPIHWILLGVMSWIAGALVGGVTYGLLAILLRWPF